jgi:hypothetical protein
VAITNFMQTGDWGGAINASSPLYSVMHNFGTKVNVWSYASLQQVDCNDDDAFVDIWVHDWDGASVKNHGAHHHPGIIVKNCSWVQFAWYARDCLALAVLTTEIFD